MLRNQFFSGSLVIALCYHLIYRDTSKLEPNHIRVHSCQAQALRRSLTTALFDFQQANSKRNNISFKPNYLSQKQLGSNIPPRIMISISHFVQVSNMKSVPITLTVCFQILFPRPTVVRLPTKDKHLHDSLSL